MQDLYIYINKNDVDTCLKYGIKLSEYSNKILKLQNMEKRGILAFLSPKDSDLYIDENYECIRVNIKNLNTFLTICYFSVYLNMCTHFAHFAHMVY